MAGESIGEIHRVLECTQTHPHGNQHQKGPVCLWVAGKVTESQPRAKQAALFPLFPLPHIQCHNTAIWVAPPWRIPKPPPLTMYQVHQDKEIWPKWKKRWKLQKKRQNKSKWWRDSQPRRCTVQNTGNQNAHRTGWIWSQDKGRSEGYEKWIKGKWTGNQQLREGNWDSDQWFGAKGRNKHLTRQNKETRIPKKMRRGLRTSKKTLNIPTSKL